MLQTSQTTGSANEAVSWTPLCWTTNHGTMDVLTFYTLVGPLGAKVKQLKLHLCVYIHVISC